jgi:hypothetical protein
MQREFSLSPAYPTCPAHKNELECITLISCGADSKPRRFLLRAFIQRPLTVSLLDQILCSAPVYQTSSILGAFAKLRKATISFVMFCLSAWNKSTPTGHIFMKFNIRVVFKTLREIQVSLNSDSNNGYCACSWRTFVTYGWILLEMRNVSDTIFFCIIHFPSNYVIFTKNQNQLVAQYSFLFVVISPTCIDQIYWPSSESHMQRCFILELSQVVTTVVVFTIIKIIKIGL